ncbi:unnamed protein product [Rhodiola kirilowii]
MAATSSYMSPLNISTLRQIVGLKKSKKARGQLLTVKFSDVAGIDEAVEELQET